MKLRLQLLQLIIACLFTSAITAQDLYSGVWRAGTGGYGLYGGLNWETFEAKWNTLNKQNFRLIDMSTYEKNGERLYTGIWSAGSGGYGLFNGLSWNKFVEKWNELNAKNLRLIDIETYIKDGERVYAGVWRAGTDKCALFDGLEWGAFTNMWDSLAKKNYRLIDVASYIKNGVRCYTGVWRAGTDGYALLNGLNWTSFVVQWQELATKNLRLINISSYIKDNVRVYMGIWRGGTDAYGLWNGTDWESLVSKWKELAGNNLRMINLETYESACDDECLNNVLMDDNPETEKRDGYNYGITAGKFHCEGDPAACPAPAADDKVYYRWPNLKIGNSYYARNSVLFDAKDQIFTLPFKDKAKDMWHNGWLYSPGSWHHAIDYSRLDGNSFNVRSAAEGTVISIGWDNWSGNTMVVSHDVGRRKDAYRTIYMHLRNGASNDCDNAWTKTVPGLKGEALENYKSYLTNTGCPLDRTQRKPKEANWGKETQTINAGLLGQKVTAGQILAWAGSTGPGGCNCSDDGATKSNTHLHIFFAHRDLTDNLWYFFDPYGIYSFASCYPKGVNDKINTECARYPIAWKSSSPGYPQTNGFNDEAVAAEISSPIIADNAAQVFVSPNPSAGNITVKYNSNKAGKISLTVYNKSGLAVANKMDYAKAGDNTYNFNLSNLLSGVFYLEVNNNNIKTRAKFIIIK